ncbi:hypothetical protein F4802DRAFT_393586 [Xylaria palmicola]|nr:hypothetical protein F4802DRAFT_393586 [Xylaria palmicola]
MADHQEDAEYYPVHIGIWTNWSRGRVFGSTLTFRRQDADLLIAFTSFFVAFVGTRVWRIICFAFHRYFATPTRQDVVYHQRQAILRNSSNPEDGVRLLTQVLWDHRDKAGRKRLSSTLVVAMLCIAAFAAAGGFSSQTSTAVGTEVLVKSLNCGFTEDLDFDKLPLVAERISNAANYAQQCYSRNSTGRIDCGRFVAKRIDADVDTEAGCPFEDNVCRLKSGNIRIDSGYMDSHKHFGLNSPTDQRMLVRKVLHCAPLTTTGYSSQINLAIGNVTLYHYGNITTHTGLHDYMATAKSIESQYSYTLSSNTLQAYANYQLDTAIARMTGGEVDPSRSSFSPGRSVYRGDADIYIAFLSGNGVVHTSPSDDAWYRVAPTTSEIGLAASNASVPAQLYFPLEPASPLGCTDQHQFCYRNSQNCGPLSSLDDATSGAAPFFNTSSASHSVYAEWPDYFLYLIRVVRQNSSGTLKALLAQLGPSSLSSQNTLANGAQGPLPPNQWQLDVIHWMDMIRAELQAAFLETAYFNPSDPSRLEDRVNFTSPDLARLCRNQKIKSTAYGSFSTFGLIFIFVVGALTILASYLLEPASYFLFKRWGYMKYAHLEWTTNATLQLQRLAHEEMGFGTWSKGTQIVPATHDGELLGCLDLENPNHPVLKSPFGRESASENSLSSQEVRYPQAKGPLSHDII